MTVIRPSAGMPCPDDGDQTLDDDGPMTVLADDGDQTLGRVVADQPPRV